MSTIAFRVDRKSGDYVKTVVQAKHAEESHFGVADGALLGGFLLCVAGLIYLLVWS